MTKTRTIPDGEPARRKRSAIYIRVSTVHQVDKDSLPMQRKELISYSKSLGVSDYEIFEDAGYSGKNLDRPAFQKMMASIRDREFTHLLVWKIDRISRNLIDFSELYSELKSLHVTFISKNEQFDTSTPSGEAMLKIILVFAELERNMISERVTATMISRASQGQWNGGLVPFGYDYDPATETFSIREDEASVCRLMRDDYLQYTSLLHASQALNNLGLRTRKGLEWSPPTIRKVLSSPFYIVTYRYNQSMGPGNRGKKQKEDWVLVENHHPAIFTAEEHQRMLAIMAQNLKLKNSPGKQCFRKYVHPFGRLCICGKCGSGMVVTNGIINADGERIFRYACSGRLRTNQCDNKSVMEGKIGEFVVNYILNMLHAKRCFSKIPTPETLEERLLTGSMFTGVDHVEKAGLHALFDLLSQFLSDSSYVISRRTPRAEKPKISPAVASLRREKDKLSRALRRLQDLYLYSEDGITQNDYLQRKSEIDDRLKSIDTRLTLLTSDTESDTTLSDEEFIRKAGHLLIVARLGHSQSICYQDLARNTAPEVLRDYLKSILDSVHLVDGYVTSIVFRNGMTHRFVWAGRK